VIEGRSPSNTRAGDRRKRALYFANGTQIVWDLDDTQQKIWIYHADSPDVPTEYSIGDEITCELLPNWKRKLTDIFAEETSAKVIAGEVAEEWHNEGREEGIAIGKEEGREEGIAIGKEEGREEGLRDMMLSMLPMITRLRFGQELSADIQQKLMQLDLVKLQALQASVETSASLEEWLTQISD